jgi:hypothetical protein
MKSCFCRRAPLGKSADLLLNTFMLFASSSVAPRMRVLSAPLRCSLLQVPSWYTLQASLSIGPSSTANLLASLHQKFQILPKHLLLLPIAWDPQAPRLRAASMAPKGRHGTHYESCMTLATPSGTLACRLRHEFGTALRSVRLASSLSLAASNSSWREEPSLRS